MHLVCPDCLTTNRVPPERLGDGPVCGRCAAPLRPGHPVELRDDTLPTYIGRHEEPVLVDFWAPWCGPCRQMAPHFEQAAAQMADVRFAKLDTDAQPRQAQAFGIRSIPTLILFQGGREVARHSGAMGASDLQRWVRGTLSR